MIEKKFKEDCLYPETKPSRKKNSWFKDARKFVYRMLNI